MQQLYYRETGSGAPVFIMHGLLGSGDNWQRIAKELAKDYRVILPDARNHGRSPHINSISYPEMATDLKSLFKNLNIEKASIIGHSMGGKTAMLFACKYPQMIDRLVIVDITPAAYSENNFVQIFEAMNSFDPSLAKSRQEAEGRVEQYIKDPLMRGFILKNLGRNDNSGFHWKVNLSLINESLKGLSGVLPNGYYPDPALFIAGGQSDYIGKERIDSIRASFPKAKIVTIKDAGHWVHYQAPQEFVEEVRRFLSDSI